MVVLSGSSRAYSFNSSFFGKSLLSLLLLEQPLSILLPLTQNPFFLGLSFSFFGPLFRLTHKLISPTLKLTAQHARKSIPVSRLNLATPKPPKQGVNGLLRSDCQDSATEVLRHLNAAGPCLTVKLTTLAICFTTASRHAFTTESSRSFLRNERDVTKTVVRTVKSCCRSCRLSPSA